MSWNPDRIKALRTSLGLSQSDFADALGLSRTASVTDLEKGNSTATGSTARMLDAIEAHGPNVGRAGKTLPDRLDAAAAELKGIARQLREGS